MEGRVALLAEGGALPTKGRHIIIGRRVSLLIKECQRTTLVWFGVRVAQIRIESTLKIK